MVTLNQYLSDKPKGEFARRLGTSPSYLSQILSGHRRPSFDMMLLIERETGGAVGPDAWREAKPGAA